MNNEQISIELFKAYTHIEYDDKVNSHKAIVQEFTKILDNRVNFEGISQSSVNGLSETFIDELPFTLIIMLNSLRKNVRLL